jgi:PAS domain-containing protein
VGNLASWTSGAALWPGFAFIAALLALAALIGLIRARRHAERALRIARAHATQEQAQHDALRSAIDAIPDGLALFDAEDRLVVCNRAFADGFARVSERRIHDARYVDLVRAAIEFNDHRLPPQARERLVAKCIDWHRQGGEPWVHELRGGMRLRVSEQRLPDGHSASICSVVAPALDSAPTAPAEMDETTSARYNP